MEWKNVRNKVKLSAARVNAGLTQEAVAREMQVGKQTISNWEKGRIIPKLAEFAFLCKLYGLQTEDLRSPGYKEKH